MEIDFLRDGGDSLYCFSIILESLPKPTASM